MFEVDVQTGYMSKFSAIWSHNHRTTGAGCTRTQSIEHLRARLDFGDPAAPINEHTFKAGKRPSAISLA